jgi:general secretion pathway protein D
LFRSTARGGDRTNLFVFITPHVIENPAEAKAILDSKKDEIDKIKEGKIKMYEKSLDVTGQEPKE